MAMPFAPPFGAAVLGGIGYAAGEDGPTEGARGTWWSQLGQDLHGDEPRRDPCAPTTAAPAPADLGLDLYPHPPHHRRHGHHQDNVNGPWDNRNGTGARANRNSPVNRR